jgi:metal-responsive CopG/Arc/MetJ family transcriptional regulator
MRTKNDPHRTFTTTLPDAVLRELEHAAKELGIRKNEIIAQALTSWIKKHRQDLLAENYIKREEK